MLNPFEWEVRRREFLKAAGVLGALGALARLGAVGCAKTPSGGRYATLTQGQVLLLGALSRHLVPPAHERPTLATPDDPHAWLPVVDRMLSSTGDHFRRLFRILCVYFEHAPVVSQRAARFSRLSYAEQAGVVAQWAESRSSLQSSGFQLFRTLVFLAVYSQPQVYEKLGYRMPCAGVPLPRPKKLVTGSEMTSTLSLTTEVVVVGSGAGGAVVAALLAEAGRDVVLLESGSYYDASHFVGTVPEIWSKTYGQQGFAQLEGTPPVVLFYGDAVGGTTTVNLGTCYRTPGDVLSRWAYEEAMPGLSEAEMAPFFEESERAVHVEETPWAVVSQRERILHAAAERLSWKHGRLFRATKGCIGCGRCLLGCPVNAKQSTLVTLVPRAAAAGARIHADARVDRVVFSDGTATGVIATVRDPGTRRPRGRLSVRAQRVVLAAGAVGTPMILLRSGLGEGRTGYRMRVQPASGCLGVFPERLNDRLGAPQAFGVEEFRGEGMMLESFFGPPDLFAALAPGYGRAHNDLVAGYPNASVLIFFFAERSSEGSVRPGSGGATVLRYALSDEDAARAVEAYRRVGRLLFEAGALRVFLPLNRPFEARSFPEFESLLAREGRRENLRLSGFHPMGSARMGADPARAVVGPYGEHHRCRGLFVADASIFPTALGVNPQITIMAFAARTARHLLSSLPPTA